jgi:excisionase family DNA binding protein
MRSRFQALSGHPPTEFGRLLDRAESLASELPAGKILDAIGRTARLDAVLRARLSAVRTPGAAPAQPDPEAGRYMNVADAARYLAVSRSTILRLTKVKILPCSRPSEGVVRYDRCALDAFMTARKTYGSGVSIG